ncbi:hypothetical protein JG687_00010533 [Phytophthora cactorum]|uniref:Uncharacterized protein n=1 Tax=Phytophthora cactorum TaxID=29920 RepID=A0A8T1UC15_9STRA|nr:hypothetical protein PC128_g2291 [Phytophthora cactorum]KAG4053108.1 hypothetical protein PC123_g11741 [Phytophthora cactorum]KAG6956556.1 hypothetical protein JG687_00010533 [Phytophthora cactorum]
MDGQEERRLLDKKNGVYCLFPGCPRTTTLTTLRFKDHFKAKHLTEGETYTTRHRDEYERACRDPARVDTPEGARIYLIELLEAVDNKLTRIDERLQRIEKGKLVSRTPPPSLRSPKQISTTRSSKRASSPILKLRGFKTHRFNPRATNSTRAPRAGGSNSTAPQ